MQTALSRLGPNPNQNELLAELIKLSGAQTGSYNGEKQRTKQKSIFFFSKIKIANFFADCLSANFLFARFLRFKETLRVKILLKMRAALRRTVGRLWWAADCDLL